MMRLFLLPAILLFTGFRASSQDSLATVGPNLYDQIMTRSSVSTLIANGREMLLESLMNDDAVKASEIIAFLNDQTDGSRYRAFSGWESFMLLYWTGHFSEICINAASMAGDRQQQADNHIFPQPDQLMETLVSQSYGRRGQIEERIDASGVSAEDKEFLKIFLRWLTTRDDDYDALNDIHKQSTAFTGRYPHSAYIYLVEDKFVITESDWNFGWGVWAGAAFMPSDLTRICGETAITAGFAFDAIYKNTLLEFNFGVEGGGLKEEAVYGNKHFLRKDSWSIVGMDLAIGQKLRLNEWLSAIPFASAGYSGFSIAAREDVEYSESAGSFRYGGGMYLDFRLAKNVPGAQGWFYPYGYASGRSRNECNLRLKYEIRSADYRLSSARRTAINTLSLEFMWFSRNIKNR